MEETRLPKSTAARLLRALERNGLAQRGSGGGFRPGPVLVDYARRDTPRRRPRARCARPFLERLEQSTGETTNIAIPTPAGVARLAQVDSHHPLGAGNWVGRRIPPHASSLGKVFMAFGAAQPPSGGSRGSGRTRSRAWPSCCTSSSRCGGAATRRRGRSSRQGSARRRPRPRLAAAR